MDRKNKKRINVFVKKVGNFKKEVKKDKNKAVEIAKGMIKECKELMKIEDVKKDKKTIANLKKFNGILDLYITQITAINKFVKENNKK